MVQAYHIREGGVEYLNRFTKTQKYTDEQAAGEFQYATWSTQAPGGVLFNLFGGIKKPGRGFGISQKWKTLCV